MITSTSNAQIKELAKLQKKSRLRDEKGIFQKRFRRNELRKYMLQKALQRRIKNF